MANPARTKGFHAVDNAGLLPPVTAAIPAILQTLFGVVADGTETRCANALVPPEMLARAVRTRIAEVLPTARILAPFHLYRGRVDLAILHRDVTIGVLLDASEPFGAAPRTGRGSEVFDYTVALAAYPKDHLLDAKPRHVWGLRAYTDFNGGVAFALARRAFAQDAPSPQRRLFADGPRARTMLDADGITGALVAHLDARHDAISISREFPCGGSVADVAVITPGELHLFEIKGASDAAARLATQAPNYDQVATTCTLVTTCNHRSFRNRVPAHWGIIEAATVRGTTHFMQLRAARRNPNRDVASLVDLLDLADLRNILRLLDCLARGNRSIPQLRRALLEAAGEPELGALALRALARRARPA